MKDIRLKARAKINLTLDVVGKREDGYHLLESIMQTVGLYDAIHIQRVAEKGIRMKSNLPWLPLDQRNLAYRAAALIQKNYSTPGGVMISLSKRIPVAAGLAGGSTNCAAVLVGMNRLFDLRLSLEELEGLAGQLGSDIPYCVRGGTVLAEGVGEVLTPITPACPECYVVLVKLPVSVSTATVYQSLRWDEISTHPDTQGMKAAMAAGDIPLMGSLLGNVLESVTIPMYPKIAVLKEEMMKFGATGALMSGSGPTVFGLFEEEDVARKAAAGIRARFGLREVFATRIYPAYGTRRGEKEK